MKAKLFALILLIGINPLHAHNPELSTYNLVKNEQAWTLEISLSQEGIHNRLLQNYDHVNALNPEQYKKLLIDYVKSNMKFVFNGEQVLIKAGSLRLGDHQTDLRFLLDNMPDIINTVKAVITVGAEEKGQINILAIHDDHSFYKLFLSSKNRYTEQGEFYSIGFVSSQPIQSVSIISNLLWILAVLIVAAGIIFLVFRKASQPSFSSSVWM